MVVVHEIVTLLLEDLLDFVTVPGCGGWTVNMREGALHLLDLDFLKFFANVGAIDGAAAPSSDFGPHSSSSPEGHNSARQGFHQ